MNTLLKILLGIGVAIGGLLFAIVVSPIVVLFLLIDIPVSLVDRVMKKDC